MWNRIVDFIRKVSIFMLFFNIIDNTYFLEMMRILGLQQEEPAFLYFSIGILLDLIIILLLELFDVLIDARLRLVVLVVRRYVMPI